MIDPEGINHAAHYNRHPSGVECIVVKRMLGSNMADAFKYVTRRDEKGTAYKDLGKAVWYMTDETSNIGLVPFVTLTGSALEVVLESLWAYRDAEPVEAARTFFDGLVRYVCAETPVARVEIIHDCIHAVEQLRADYAADQFHESPVPPRPAL